MTRTAWTNLVLFAVTGAATALRHGVLGRRGRPHRSDVVASAPERRAPETAVTRLADVVPLSVARDQRALSAR